MSIRAVSALSARGLVCLYTRGRETGLAISFGEQNDRSVKVRHHQESGALGWPGSARLPRYVT